MSLSVKKSISLTLYVLFFTTSLFAAPAAPTYSNEELLKQISRGFSEVAKKTTPAVVYIESQGVSELPEKKITKKGPYENPFDYFDDDFFNRFFGFPFDNKPQPKSTETVRGSGFLVSKDGYIVTNNHVVDNASKVTVTINNGKKLTATVVGTDPKTDLAVVKVEGNDYPFLTFGDSDKLEVGDWAIAIGNPFGLQASVTVGVVSAKGRNQLNIADIEDFIQTDAAINPGNSGGPLLNVAGEVIGVDTAIVSGSGGYMGIGFAIPSNMAKLIIHQLITEGEVTRGFLGVTLQPLDTELASFYHLKQAQGALVTDVTENSPADKGGLKQEDVILSYNGTTVENLGALRNYVSLLPPGSKLKLMVLRDGKEIELNMVVAQSPTADLNSSPLLKLGLHVQEITPKLAQKYGLSDQKGILITQIDPSSLAAEYSLKPGDVILEVNRQKVKTLAEFNKIFNEAVKEGRILLKIQQGEVILFVALRPNKESP